MTKSRYQISFDTGGTFTDFALKNESTGQLIFGKVPSTNSDPSMAVLKGMEKLLEGEKINHSDLSGLYHATTVATNAILERRGARCALITTKGFRDVFLIGRQKRYETYDLYLNKPDPLVLRKDVYEVNERVDHKGSVLTALSEQEISLLIEQLRQSKYEAVAVSLLHSYANTVHEKKIADAIRAQIPGMHVSISAEISPKFREFERTSTVLADSYIKPVVDQYISRMTSALAACGVQRDFLVMQSNGGLVTPELSKKFPVRIVESGPAAGVSMCAVIGAALGKDHLLTFDMGGTTAKLGAIDDGKPAIAPTFEVDQTQYRSGSGLPLNISAIEMLEIGAGGGSIASIDAGVIRVGPESAGAEPGPICYGNGGTQPTITDANLILGYLNPEYFNGGEMELDVKGAEEGVHNYIAEPLDLSLEEAAWGVHAVANANMERAMRIVSIEKGRDPRRYAVVGFGGAGPIHVCRLARSLGAPTVIVPYGAGVGSALGLLAADSRLDASATRVLNLNEARAADIEEIFDGLRDRLVDEVAAFEGEPKIEWSRALYARYAGQGYEIRVDLPDGVINADYMDATIRAFHETYSQHYGYSQEGVVVEAADWSLAATIKRNSQAIDNVRFDDGTQNPVHSVRTAYFPEAGGYTDCQILNRARLLEIGSVTGPAIIEDSECTIVIPPKDVVSLSDRGDVIVNISQKEG